VALVLTGMVNYRKLGVGDPLAFVLDPKVRILGGLQALLILQRLLLFNGPAGFQIGQPRIWMSMSRDGLLPPIFSKIHPKYRTPSFSTLLTGFVVAIPSLFMNLSEVTDLTSIGTLFALYWSVEES